MKMKKMKIDNNIINKSYNWQDLEARPKIVKYNELIIELYDSNERIQYSIRWNKLELNKLIKILQEYQQVLTDD